MDERRAATVGPLAEICFAGGCFWGVEEYFARVPGVLATTAGYANGRPPANGSAPTYEQVCTGRTGFAEAVLVRYDPRAMELRTLAELFFTIIDPLSRDRQGNDVGNQYRTGIYYVHDTDRAVLEHVMAAQQARHAGPLAVELAPLRTFFAAEDYHQRYLRKNPGGYCHISFASLEQVKAKRGDQ